MGIDVPSSYNTPLSRQSEPKDCDDIKEIGQNETKTDVFRIRPDGTSSFFVRCDMEILGGGWTVIQRRVSGSDFFKDWKTYQEGFGNLDTNFWLGLEQIHYLSRQDRYELRVDMTDYEGTTKYASYNVFELGDLSSGYELTVDGYSGTAGDNLSSHNGQPFSTYDNDNDNTDNNCAVLYVGKQEKIVCADIPGWKLMCPIFRNISAWWYKTCHQSNLNGDYGNDDFGKGLNWLNFTTYYKSLISSEMKIRKVST
ncbi:FBCDA-like protein [Mya arenaria]|uniref:FBCDA-like protein n=1 Tax=Mya arenaria TaxID=6604 RepID=A0ABY7F6R5_MYAAR|nr:FBCDA-like protein [Mya arenaria]